MVAVVEGKTPPTSTTSQEQTGDSSDEIDAEISRLEDDVETDEDVDDRENPNYQPSKHGAQLLN